MFAYLPYLINFRTVLSWCVKDIDDITEESLALFPIIEPKLDIIVVGIGDSTKDFMFYRRLLPFSNKYRLNIEILPTDQACSTFNFLNSEGRYVAGAFIPPTHVEASDDDVLRTKLKYQSLYETDI